MGEILLKTDSYYKEIVALIEEIEKTQKEKIKKAGQIFAEKIMNDKIIHVFGTGHSHMTAEELFVRAGGIANINAWLDPSVLPVTGARRSSKMERLNGLAKIIWEEQKVGKNDILMIISNSGRN